MMVLIPLLLDDPLWGFINPNKEVRFTKVLIPLLLDDPLWARSYGWEVRKLSGVLIPLLLDDPLWVENEFSTFEKISLNPSFAG